MRILLKFSWLNFFKPTWGKVVLTLVLLFLPVAKEQFICGPGLPGFVCPSRYIRGYEIVLGLADRLTILILPRGYYLSTGIIDDLLRMGIVFLSFLLLYIVLSTIFAITKRVIINMRS